MIRKRNISLGGNVRAYIGPISIIFSMNLAWELSQMFLYEKHSDGLIETFLVHARAALGDVVLFLCIVAVGNLLLRDRSWYLRSGFSKYAFSSLIGAILAFFLEWYALETYRWAYADGMPLIPFTRIGLVPVLQMTVLPAAFLFFWHRFRSSGRDRSHS